MSPITQVLLSQGWIQVGGEDIPVYFRYEPNDTEFPFHIIFCAMRDSYYDLQNYQVNSILTKNLKVSVFEFVNTLIKGAFEHVRSTPQMFTYGILTAISDYYHHNRETDKKLIYETLSKQSHEYTVSHKNNG